MKKERLPIPVLLRNVALAALAFCLVLATPTGWLYDLWAGTGTGQGQRPGEGVSQLRRQEDAATFFYAQTPATVAGGELVACPLARLRDVEQAGVHKYNSTGARRTAYTSEYILADYPLPAGQRALQGLVGGFYNRYYLTALEDGSYLCVYFDDYLTLTGSDKYPTGYVRYATAQERQMLAQMSEDYAVDTAYVLDMYRHGKVSWMLDLLLRLGVLFAVGAAASAAWGAWKKRKAEVAG